MMTMLAITKVIGLQFNYDDDDNGDDNNDDTDDDDKEDDDDNDMIMMTMQMMTLTRSVMLQPRSMASQTMKAAESPKTTFNHIIY